MNIVKKLQKLIFLFVFLFVCAPQVSAAAPDGLGPWADNVVSSSQGLMKNGLAVPAARSNTAAALGVAENDTVDAHFFSLGFGGNIILGFDNGISTGVIVVEATNPNYPGEKAKIEVSENGTTWTNAGTITQDGQVTIPEAVQCAKFVRITDVSDPAIMPDDIADGYDVDGAQAVGDLCNPQPTPTPTQAVTPTPTQTPNTPNSPGFPNTGGGSCTSNGVTSVPGILTSSRVSPTSVFLSWGPDAGLHDFIVQYGFQNGNFQFSTAVSGFSTTIGSLPPNQSVWVEVAATDNCLTGKYSTAVLVGGNSPGFPNTGNPLIPGLPNTGVGPNSSWSIWNGIHSFVAFFLNAFHL